MASQLYVLGEERYGRETGKGNLVLCYDMYCKGIVKRGCGDNLHILKSQYRYTYHDARSTASICTRRTSMKGKISDSRSIARCRNRGCH